MKHNSNSSFIHQVIDLVGHPGNARDASTDVIVQEKMGEGMVAVVPQTPLHIQARFESTHEGIFVTAHVSTEANGECSRCLNVLTLAVEVAFQELFAYSSKEAYDYEVHNNHVDLEPLTRDAVVLSLPFQPICRPACADLHYENLFLCDDKNPNDTASISDRRWSALLDFQASETDSLNSNEKRKN